MITETEHCCDCNIVTQLLVLLMVLFNAKCYKTCICAKSLLQGHFYDVIQLVKARQSRPANVTNYRRIMLSSVVSKIFEMCLLDSYSDILYSEVWILYHSIILIISCVLLYQYCAYIIIIDSLKLYQRLPHMHYLHKIIQICKEI